MHYELHQAWPNVVNLQDLYNHFQKFKRCKTKGPCGENWSQCTQGEKLQSTENAMLILCVGCGHTTSIPARLEILSPGWPACKASVQLPKQEPHVTACQRAKCGWLMNHNWSIPELHHRNPFPSRIRYTYLCMYQYRCVHVCIRAASGNKFIG